MQIHNLNDAKLITITSHLDSRGWFAESWSDKWMEELGITKPFVQANTVHSELQYTIRGLHAQTSPHQTAKLLQVISGAVMDVFVDARLGSSTFGQWNAIMLDEGNPRILYIPAGFYHGYITLTDNTVVHYQQDEYFTRESECGLLWNDPEINIDWNLNGAIPIVSAKDHAQPDWHNAIKF